MKQVGLSMKRVDAYDKATGRTLYGGDRVPQNALVAKIVHSTIAHGMVKHIDTTEAERIPGVVKIVTCFDVPDIQFPTAGHPWSLDPSHRDRRTGSCSTPTSGIMVTMLPSSSRRTKSRQCRACGR